MALEEFQHPEQKPPTGMDFLAVLRNEANTAVTTVDFWETMKDIEKELQHIHGAEGSETEDERVRDLETIKKELNQRYQEKFGGSLLQ
ncbi:MAG TPA: hypothetical protein VJB70_01495 [Candidatus Paceibacterota bacterium]